MSTTASQGLIKLQNILCNPKTLRKLAEDLKEIYLEYERHTTQKYPKYLQRSLALIKRINYALLAFCLTALSTVIILPFIFYYVKNEKLLVGPMQIPGIDVKDGWGFRIHFCVQAAMLTIGTYGNFAADSFCFLLLSHTSLFKDLLYCKFQDLDEILLQYPRNSLKSKPLLQDILKWHQKHVLFIETASSTYFWVILVQISTAVTGIVTTLVCQFLGIYPNAVGYLIYCAVLFYIYCGIGNLYESVNEEVIDIIYDSLWYNLTINEQKLILFMLHKSQTVQGLTIGKLIPLSLNTALKLTRSMYTLSMMLLQFLD
ncbi:odorant receptor 67d-like [Glossina fuscipes]|uniref:Odorant receptor 67d-like n=1 Tax=Glossina fuscipes TaxID=7396 RepID=A0A8U0W7L1_9MUSC|nr:odorant receptor 67d-like [Glossina fuscipes]